MSIKTTITAADIIDEPIIALDIGGDRVSADWETDVDRTAPDGKTSSIHFIHFRITPEQADKFRDPGVTAAFVIGHANYTESTPITGAVRDDLIGDL